MFLSLTALTLFLNYYFSIILQCDCVFATRWCDTNDLTAFLFKVSEFKIRDGVTLSTEPKFPKGKSYTKQHTVILK